VENELFVISLATKSKGGYKMADDIQEIGFDDEEVQVFEVEFFKGKKGYNYRIAFPLLGEGKDGSPVPFTLKARVHYKDGFGTFLCRSTPDNKEVCCKTLGDSGLRFGTIIVHYHTEKDGRPKKPFGYDLKFWYFSDKKFDKLRSLHREFSLAERDMLISCDNDEYQHLNFTPTKESIMRVKEELAKKIIEQAEKLKSDLKKRLAKSRSIEEIREELGLEVTGGQIDESSIGDYSDVLDEI